MIENRQLPESGELMGAKYRVERLLGIGGMGAVYEASHRVTGKRFALKLLLPELTAQQDVVRRFIREAQVAGRFQHPNVVEVYDIGEYGESFFMVMELLRGESLADRLARDRTLPVAEACEIIGNCLDAVAAAHAAGIIHRDLKPANIFLCQTRTPGEYLPKVLDFGISKLAEHPSLPKITTTDTGTVMGTPFYMAPEQLRSRGVDHRVDLYALGVTLYELLSGRQPFVASNYPDLVIKIWSESPVPLETLVPEIPPELAAAVARAMARNAADRFATAEAMALALAFFARHRPQASPPPRPSSPPPEPVSVRPPPQPRSPRPASYLDTTQRTATPFASESLISRSARMKRMWSAPKLRWLLGAAALAATGYGIWLQLEDEESPDVEAQSAEPSEPLQPTAAMRPEPEAPPGEVPKPEPPAPLIASAPQPTAAAPLEPAPVTEPEPESPPTPQPTAARRRAPAQPTTMAADPVLPFQRPNPSIDRTQF
ncbi:MAG TPA: protein kinase [Polyangiales bacterium]|nr:protein kinase [Polyangiales bacterium]